MASTRKLSAFPSARVLRKCLPYVTALCIMCLLYMTRPKRRVGYGEWAEQDWTEHSREEDDSGKVQSEVVEDKGGLFLQGHKWCYDKSSFATENRTEHRKQIQSGQCMCDVGWSGLDCNTAVCENCKHGKCIRPDTCKCKPGWEGNSCD
eukprot:CAMPEP_0118948486 /NCGR_PEP_ID=MMETSP1169-20130426/47920_1 /TAXON_ID=36882 /ORGANISM="Pyramimonas obovata, Strain CCMP722" /LENGTH=148 /DNA_ID=CAMNT_0006894925 /DNA_START=27 /DNA_END=470 /DNA_ORIENTATION=+